jgi:Lrp/AsnC family leucine-responsive transcriptional regulator
MISTDLFGNSELDELDVRLLDALQRNARSTYAELGQIVGLKPPAVHERVKRLETRGYVRGYAARLDSRLLGLELVAFIGCYSAPEANYDTLVADLAALPEVCEVHSVAGEESFIIKTVTRSTAHLDDLLGRLKRITGLARTKTTIVLSTPFERGGITVSVT